MVWDREPLVDFRLELFFFRKDVQRVNSPVDEARRRGVASFAGGDFGAFDLGVPDGLTFEDPQQGAPSLRRSQQLTGETH